MNYFDLYYVDIDYIKYLYQYENKVQYNPRQKAKIYGGKICIQ